MDDASDDFTAPIVDGEGLDEMVARRQEEIEATKEKVRTY